MRRPVEHRERGIFVAEGEKVVRRLVASRLRIVSLLMTGEWYERYEHLLEERDIEDGVYIAERKFLEEIVGYRLHQGIMAIGRVPDSADIFADRRKDGKSLLLVALDGVANSENMGVIIRNCAAFGVDGVIVGEASCDPYLRRSVRNSMGTLFDLPIAYSDNLARALENMRTERGAKVIAANPRDGALDIGTVDLTGDICLVFGAEGEGISHSVLSVCDAMVTIPMRNDVDSINVGSSVGVALYECNRQRA